jgi:hypothetical protein
LTINYLYLYAKEYFKFPENSVPMSQKRVPI